MQYYNALRKYGTTTMIPKSDGVCDSEILDYKEKTLNVDIKNGISIFGTMENLIKSIEMNEYIKSISLVSCKNDDVATVESIFKIDKKLRKMRFSGFKYGRKFSSNFANYINNNENLEVIYLAGTGLLIGKEFCLAINKHKKIDKLILLYDNGCYLEKYFSHILLSANLRVIDISYSFIEIEKVYSNFLKDLKRSNIEEFDIMGGFKSDDKEIYNKFVDGIFNSLRIGNKIRKFSTSIDIDIFIDTKDYEVMMVKNPKYLSGSFYEFLDKCESIQTLCFNFITSFGLSDEHHNKTLDILEKKYGITKFKVEGMCSDEKSDEYSRIIQRNRRFWKNGVVSLKCKILGTIKKEKIKAPENYPKMLFYYDRTTLVINFENYMNRNKEKKRKNY